MKALGGPKDSSKDPALKTKVAKKPSNELSLSDLTSGASRSPVKRFDPTEAVCDSNGLNKNHDQFNNMVCSLMFDDVLMLCFVRNTPPQRAGVVDNDGRAIQVTSPEHWSKFPAIDN